MTSIDTSINTSINTSIETSIDKDLRKILTGGAQLKTKNKIKGKSKSKNKTKTKTKTKSKSKSKTQLKKKENGIIKSLRNELLVNEMMANAEMSRPKRPIVVKKNADENKEYISVKKEKISKEDNTYKQYDVAFLKRLKRSKADVISSDEENE